MSALRGDMAADEVIKLLGLQPHPEGGWYGETYRDAPADGSRGSVTHIHYVLKAGEVSAWHRIDATEIWHWYGGAPLVLTTSPPDGVGARAVTLGPGIRTGQSFTHVVGPQHWQTSESLGAWSLMGCTVSPAFDFAGFEMAPKDWRPQV